jgi:hypothetical protein
MWNMTESGLPKYFLRFMFPLVCYNRKIFLSSRAYPMMTEEAVLRWSTGLTNRLVLEPAPADEKVTRDNIFVVCKERVRLRVLCTYNLERT